MQILDKIFKRSIQPNDTRGFVGFEVDGQILQPQRLAQRDLLTIAGLQANTVYQLDMRNHLGHDLLVTGLSADIASDDAKVLQAGNTRPNYTTIQIFIQLLDRTNFAVKREIVLFISSYSSNIGNDLILGKDALYRIKVNQACNDLSIVGIPVVVGTPAIAYNLPVIAQSN